MRFILSVILSAAKDLLGPLLAVPVASRGDPVKADIFVSDGNLVAGLARSCKDAVLRSLARLIGEIGEVGVSGMLAAHFQRSSTPA